MKFLEFAPLSRIGNFLDHVDLGEYVVSGQLEVYSCKLAGFDKKLSRSLEQEVQAGTSPLELSASPVGPLTESQSRRTLIYLILTLNNIYPDYDFSQLRAQHFRKERTLADVEEDIDGHLLEASRVWEETPGFGDSPLLESLWSAVDEAVELKECDLYTYNSDLETDPFGEKGSVWSFNYFFYNKKLKRILYFSCRGKSKTAAQDDSEVENSDYKYNSDGDDGAEEATADYGMANDMDL
uniref:Repressor of RNA polymerase III transcription n=1 Tax=Tetraselmis chuii TaxID=63592 RepID=A0A7S1SVR9_9CHLO|mmetsp:Transcript_31671/g.56691  ORF Transcript_31671/g.56691 Transcript_31671/m.56691 type:complete len:239 (+) Transcript_31671:611-1327(+)|eukprot:CAMPEP_0177781958 /NCGR_PEP_ID=MMETSP0491_2-20121128/18164_1 /TAXON_ID=63592 /ORGANISM="Tetraselmis chuii, Strain PLY429" /LENGTH=238 /DNA_ID=CAMNT_0019302131 /DNA_START=613 /DNA_END=1329 /DNA_ORIENTATION=-